MFRLKLIKHEFITEQDIKDIIFIKSKQWDFDSYSQRKWILENIKETDLHLILTLWQFSLIDLVSDYEFQAHIFL